MESSNEYRRMMARRTALRLAACAVLAMAASFPAGSAEIRTGALELRRDRVYLPLGEEALIFIHSPLHIVSGSDTIFTGLIEHSWDGISVSAPTHGLFDTLSLATLEAIVTQAEIDSAHPIAVGSGLAGLPLRADTLQNPSVEWTTYKDAAALREDLAAGIVDAAVLLSRVDPQLAEVTSLSAPCPMIAVMVPQIGRKFNYQGELTTSLYYRFDSRRLALSFPGDEVTIVNRLTPPPDTVANQPRWYDFDPARGKRLLDRLAQRPSRVRLYSGHPSLDGLTRYFADILSRDKCVVDLTPDRALADVSIEYVPYAPLAPLIALDTLRTILARDSIPGSGPAEYLRRIDRELELLETSFTPEDSGRRLDNVSRIMAQDLGVFPLFRPTLFVHMQRGLRGVVIDPSGRVNFGAAVLVRLPQAPTGGRP